MEGDASTGTEGRTEGWCGAARGRERPGRVARWALFLGRDDDGLGEEGEE